MKTQTNSTKWLLRMLLLLVVVLIGANAYGQTTAFTYQGKLTDNGNPASGQFDFQFKLFDALSAGTQQGTTQCASVLGGRPRWRPGAVVVGDLSLLGILRPQKSAP